MSLAGSVEISEKGNWARVGPEASPDKLVSALAGDFTGLRGVGRPEWRQFLGVPLLLSQGVCWGLWNPRSARADPDR